MEQPLQSRSWRPVRFSTQWSTSPSEDFGGSSGSQLSLGTSAECSTNPTQDFQCASGSEPSQEGFSECSTRASQAFGGLLGSQRSLEAAAAAERSSRLSRDVGGLLAPNRVRKRLQSGAAGQDEMFEACQVSK